MSKILEVSISVPQHYLLVKCAAASRLGVDLSAMEAAKSLLEFGWWPLWNNTPCKNAIMVGDRVAIYLAAAGNGCIIATAVVESISTWTSTLALHYPLSLKGFHQGYLGLDNYGISLSRWRLKCDDIFCLLLNQGRGGASLLCGECEA